MNNPRNTHRHFGFAVAAGLGSVSVGSAWQLLSRHSVQDQFTPTDLAFLRYVIPAVVLMPILIRHRLTFARVGWKRCLSLVALGGAPFVLVVLLGAQLAPAAHIGVLLSGTVPLFTALIATYLGIQKLSRDRKVGLLLILFAASILLVNGSFMPELSTLPGDLLFLVAAAMWGAFTISLRSAALTAWQSTALVSFGSCLVVVPIGIATGLPTLRAASIDQLLVQSIGQGIMAGLVGTALYNLSVSKLGPQPAASFAALTPTLTAAGGWLFLAEPLSKSAMASALLAGAGVLLATGAAAYFYQLAKTDDA
jgi:drug/metabolite transporter (DMT)-like permease